MTLYKRWRALFKTPSGERWLSVYDDRGIENRLDAKALAKTRAPEFWVVKDARPILSTRIL